MQYPVSGSGLNLSLCFRSIDYFKLGVAWKMVFAQPVGELAPV